MVVPQLAQVCCRDTEDRESHQKHYSVSTCSRLRLVDTCRLFKGGVPNGMSFSKAIPFDLEVGGA